MARKYCSNHCSHLALRASLPSAESRFWTEVEISDGCWLWNGKPNSSGYGRFFYNGKRGSAHRFSYELHNKIRLGPTEFVCHKCDTPLCVRPDHLFLGDAKINADDMLSKGRNVQVRGTHHGMSKLTEFKVRLIRQEFSELPDRLTFHEKCKVIALHYNVTTSNIRTVINGKTWRHVA